MFVSSITVAELHFGVCHSAKVEQNRLALTEFLTSFSIIDFETNAAEWYGQLREQLNRKGQPIGPYDLLIAAQALTNNLILVTNNQKEFQRIEQLKLDDWR
jgi:tRNA(fMet)-specific endonuclease VapC